MTQRMKKGRVSISCLLILSTNKPRELNSEQRRRVALLYGEQSKGDDKIKIDCFVGNFRKDIK